MEQRRGGVPDPGAVSPPLGARARTNSKESSRGGGLPLLLRPKEEAARRAAPANLIGRKVVVGGKKENHLYIGIDHRSETFWTQIKLEPGGVTCWATPSSRWLQLGGKSTGRVHSSHPALCDLR